MIILNIINKISISFKVDSVNPYFHTECTEGWEEAYGGDCCMPGLKLSKNLIHLNLEKVTKCQRVKK